MTTSLQQLIVQKLIGDTVVPERKKIEAAYPKRSLPEDAEVTRVCPSPTGFVHIGTIFTALLCERVAHQSEGVYILRIEDTDKKREVVGAAELIVSQLTAFGLQPDEGIQADGSTTGSYGPYVQSERRQMYLSYALDLLYSGRAYPCFATPEELQDALSDQQKKKLRPGYYGQWALWRDRPDEEVEAALLANKKFVLRFRSEGSHEKRLTFNDAIKGTMHVPENDLDIPLIKSDELRLPTYHLAHVVDDHLMGATIIMRGEEWLPSTPLHIELAQALHIEPFRYAHTPVISIIDKQSGGKRKLSKRKDSEADVAYWLKAAYPIESIKAYLMGLANSNFEDWRRENPTKTVEDFPFSLDKLAASRSPLLDMKKLEDYAKDDIAAMSQAHFNKEVLAWVQVHDHDLYQAMMQDPEYTAEVLVIERDGEKPRKDVAKWSDVPEQYTYFFDELFEQKVLPPSLCDLNETVSPDDQRTALAAYIESYRHDIDKDVWFSHLKQAAEHAGYALDRKELKNNPDGYKGGLADFASIVRVWLTGKTRTPDLFTIMQAMGEKRVRARLTPK